MTRKKASEIFDRIQGLDKQAAIDVIFEWGKELEGSGSSSSPLTPSGAVPVYQKPNTEKKRKKKPGRKKGHPGQSRKVPDRIDRQQEHPLETCPHCQNHLKEPTKTRKRYIEDMPQTEPVVTEHIINGYWCPHCRKIVEPAVVEAMPNDNIGLHTFVMTAWMHYIGGISINYIVDMMNKLFQFQISPGALNQGWIRLAQLIKSEYEKIGYENA